MNDKISKILARGIIIKYTFDNNKIEYDNIEISNDNENVLEGINLLLDEEKEFFLLSHVSNLDFIKTTYELMSKYRNLQKRNTNLINDIIGKLNMLSIENVDLDKVEAYIEKDMISRGIISDNLEDITYGMLYDAAIYCALVNNEFNIDNYNAIISSTNYLLSNIPEIYKDNNIYQNTLIMIDSVIKNSLPLTNRKKVAKYTKKNLETLRIQE